MKNKLFFLLLFLSVCFVGCGKSKKSDLDIFVKAVDSQTNNTIYGLEYEKVQIYDNLEVYKRTIDSKIVSYNESKAKVSFYEKQLNEFPSDTQFSINEYIKYYDGLNVVTYKDGKETKSNEVFKELTLNLNLKDVLFLENIKSYKIDASTVTINIKKENGANIFNIDNIEDIKVIITVNAGKIDFVKTTYKINNSDFSISYKLNYSAFNSDILNK